jgi:hypothetical protein
MVSFPFRVRKLANGRRSSIRFRTATSSADPDGSQEPSYGRLLRATTWTTELSPACILPLGTIELLDERHHGLDKHPSSPGKRLGFAHPDPGSIHAYHLVALLDRRVPGVRPSRWAVGAPSIVLFSVL